MADTKNIQIFTWEPLNKLNVIDDVSFSKAMDFFNKGYVESVKPGKNDSGESIIEAYFNVKVCSPFPEGLELEPQNRSSRLTI